jgi:murein DD-endopeptidase MepM/ murein hydrolase activator NlpD
MTGAGPALLLIATLAAGPGRLPAGRAADRAPPPQVTRLSLPFAGIWGVIQGFDSGTHHGYAAFALDFVPAQRLTPGLREPPRGAPLSAFACMGRPVLAPADGTVVAARGGARDWPAHVKGHDEGNYVILRHAPHEYTEFRHLAAGSVGLKPGDVVRRGELIGRCGNSGNAGTPHLHLGFLSSFDPIVTRPMVLSEYQVLTPAGWRPGDGTPRKGQILRSTPDAGRE